MQKTTVEKLKLAVLVLYYYVVELFAVCKRIVNKMTAYMLTFTQMLTKYIIIQYLYITKPILYSFIGASERNSTSKQHFVIRRSQWRNKVAVGPRASIPKGPPLPHSGFVCRLQCKQTTSYSGKFQLDIKSQCHTSKSQIFPLISDETSYCRLERMPLVRYYSRKI